MQGRTFIRTMLDILFDNALSRAIMSVVNFCNEQAYYNNKELKFLKKMPIKDIKNNYIHNKFIFDTTKAVKTGLK